MEGRVLAVGGSDSGGGAGIQADIKTITMLGSYAATAITALTAQDTRRVHGVVAVDPRFVAMQMEAVLDDIGVDCIKTGMLVSADVVEAVVRTCEKRARGVPVVVDPVMVAKGGARLLDDAALEVLRLRLVPIASLITPNVPEAETLTGIEIQSVDDLARAADALLARGAGAVLVKGGHLEGDTVVDLLRTADGDQRYFEAARVISTSTHGTGCTLASAIAAGVARGLRLADAIEAARAYLLEAIKRAPGLGRGHGPLNHAHPLEPKSNGGSNT